MSEDKANNCYRGRLAPTPSGFLHQGHIQTFRQAWERARHAKGKLVFRMDDLDQARCTQDYYDACMEDMKGMGLDWDEGPDIGGSFGPYVQSVRKEKYLKFVQKLFKEGLIYPCTRSRKEVREHGLLSACKNEYLYPESFRPSKKSWNQTPFSPAVNWRFCTAWGEQVLLEDKRLGEKSFVVGENFSDFLVWRKEGTASYELATVVDDILMRITEVVRGEDLLVSSARQSLLFNAFKHTTPGFYHCELVKGVDGKKLSKSSRSLPRLFSLS